MMAEEKKVRTIHFINGTSRKVPQEIVDSLVETLGGPNGLAPFQSFAAEDKLTLLLLNVKQINYID